ncbi:MAG: hypothetical protein EPO57_06255 [Chitinophagaceae bacterium]|nr:MAG: hypothetical protein EPO57_06255 [Chitinophagaceae bacterium]
MRNIVLLFISTLFLSITASAQEDSITQQEIIIKKDTIFSKGNIHIAISPKITNWHKRKSNTYSKNITTKRWIIDPGFSNYADNTNYNAAQASNLVGIGVDKNRMEINDRKLTNVNIWFFMKRINLIQHIVNLKYGAGLELNNYRFKDAGISFQKNPTKILYQPLSEVKKAKLAVDYFTVPVLLNFNFKSKSKKEFGLSGGVSVGYLYNARSKSKSMGGVQKTKDDFDLNRWKLSYIGEVALGRTSIYGSYAFRSMWANELKMTPFTIGIRLKH